MSDSLLIRLRYPIILLALAVVVVSLWMVLSDRGGSEDEPSIEQSAVHSPKDNGTEVPAKDINPREDAPQETETISEKQTASGKKDFRVADPGRFASVNAGNFFTTADVTDLVPDQPTDSFQTGQRVYAYAEIRAPMDETIHFSWYDAQGSVILPSSYLDVKTNTSQVGYRVYTYRIFRSPGSYSVAVFNSPGTKLAEQAFTVR